MRNTLLKMIGIELCIAGWDDKAIEKEQRSIRDKEEEELSSIYWTLRVKRMDHKHTYP